MIIVVPKKDTARSIALEEPEQTDRVDQSYLNNDENKYHDESSIREIHVTKVEHDETKTPTSGGIAWPTS